MKAKVLSGLRSQTVDADRPFTLRADSRERAVGAAPEQFLNETTGMPTSEDVESKKRAPVVFCSRKLTTGQVKSWSSREKDTL